LLAQESTPSRLLVQTYTLTYLTITYYLVSDLSSVLQVHTCPWYHLASATFPPAGGHALPLKLRLGDGGSRAAGSDTCTGSDRDGSDTASDGAAEPWPAVGACLPLGLRLPPGLGPPPGLCREPTLCAAAPAGRTALRSQAEVYSPLRSQAEAFVPKCLALAGVARPRLGGAGPEASKWTTVMIRNVPLSYTCDRLIDLLESTGLSRRLQEASLQILDAIFAYRRLFPIARSFPSCCGADRHAVVLPGTMWPSEARASCTGPWCSQARCEAHGHSCGVRGLARCPQAYSWRGGSATSPDCKTADASFS
ncbi:unnamed protein product, partial [Prorocentrum cordatum]